MKDKNNLINLKTNTRSLQYDWKACKMGSWGNKQTRKEHRNSLGDGIMHRFYRLMQLLEQKK